VKKDSALLAPIRDSAQSGRSTRCLEQTRTTIQSFWPCHGGE